MNVSRRRRSGCRDSSRDFFPWVKAGAKEGEQWADTSAKTTTDGTDSVVVKRITAYRVVGKEKRDSQKALRVTSEYQSTVAGTQPTPNGPARIEGTGKGTGTYFVSPDGVYLGGDWQLAVGAHHRGRVRQRAAADHDHPDDQGHGPP